ncbi:hypothetical protein BHE75_03371 [Sphingomonas haloaromaticamans]|uniref:YnbE-like lipoprotein n=2 Tax=Edaphosphingomonas TaxID=3423724 RepID=A0A1S1HGJ5_9SPHN|nr:hypothetical protein BHE75_03371 [Sphingomonas haloaromaticamans]
MSFVIEADDCERKTGLPMRGMRLIFCGGAVLLAGGCIQVKAPEKPIEINLNVNVKQEVVVRLQKDAQEFITENPELFPQ